MKQNMSCAKIVWLVGLVVIYPVGIHACTIERHMARKFFLHFLDEMLAMAGDQ